MTNKFKCCICFKEFEGYGNNPEPVLKKGRCCDECNEKWVIPIRLFLAKRNKEKENEHK